MTWNGCGRRLRSGSVVRSRVIVPIVENTFSRIWQAHCLVSCGTGTALAMSGHVVYHVEGNDCVDYLDLARYFPPWTVMREVSGRR